MKKKLLLHAGMGKTGTTALQEFFWANREALGRAGIAYPEIGVEAGAHHRLSAHIPPSLAATQWEYLEPDQWVGDILACPQDRVLISSELNSSASRKEIKRFVDAVAPHVDLRVIFYLRRPDNYVMADYNQQVKAGIEKRPLETALEEYVRQADFPQKIGFWSELLGENAIHLRVYEREAFKGGDIVTDFLEEVLGIPDTGFARVAGKNANPRLTPELLNYKRLLNNALPDMRDSAHFIALLAAYAEMQDAGIQGIYQDQALLSPEQRCAILERYADGMADVAHRYFGRDDGVLFSQPLEMKSSVTVRPIEELAPEISRWMTARFPVEYAFLRAQVADVLGMNRSGGDIDAATILDASFDGDAPAAPIALLAPARLWDARHAELRAGLSSAEAARDSLKEQMQALSDHAQQTARDSAAELEGRAAAYSREIADLRVGLTEAESGRDTLRELMKAQGEAYSHEITQLRAGLSGAEAANVLLGRQLEDLRQERARIVEEAQAEIAEVDAQRAKLQTDIDFLANEVSIARFDVTRALSEREQMKGELGESVELLRNVRAHEAALLASTSWRITAPLRWAGRRAHGIKTAPRSSWLAVNRIAQRSYRAVAKHNPKLASKLKKTLWPALMLGNRIVLKSNYLPMNLQERAIKGPIKRLDFQRPRATLSYAPLVSIIVPNYNHAPYLTKRLESIYAQTYGNVEVLLMDDCSTDESRLVLQRFADRYPDRTRVLFNENNSGGVFFQWEKGLSEAKGDLVWIAESDDWASENFLETLIPFFENQAVQLAYAPTVFMNGTGDEQVWTMDHCLAGLNPQRWHKPFIETSARIVAQAFAERNIVPNVSSAVFRKMDRLDVLENDLWRKMRTCGDWLFYLNVIRGGCIAFSPEATNFYRLHDKNTSRTSYASDSFYVEHEVIAKALQRLYDVPWDVFERQAMALRDHWKLNRPDDDEGAFDTCYSLDRIAAERVGRKPNLLMVGFAFCAGGGETFPIQLANLMKTSGYNVTFLDCAQEPEVSGIRAMLARDIPVVSNFEGVMNIAEAFDIDVIHSHHAWVDNTILDLLPPDAKAQTVVSLHGMYETIPEGDLQRILPRLVERTGKLIYTAEKNLGALLAHGLVEQGEIERIDNALELKPITPVDRAELGISNDAFVLTLVARAMEEKGWFEAVEAVLAARKSTGRDIRLVLIGEGAVYDKLKAKPVPEGIHLLGFKPNIRDYFAASDMGFLPSRFKGESFPLVLIDCLNAGRPVLASNVGEIGYMLQADAGTAGALFDLKDWKIDVIALAEQIGALATDAAAMQELAGRVPEAAARFDPLLMRDRYDVAYQRTVAAAQDRKRRGA
jgi:glycosyltransferase involved in cell wall biosynthesis/predicted  nucleic acid-binding Zn-ribbon protein